MTIGELSSAAGVHPATVRYDEQRGLLAAAPRTRAGYRVYDGDAVRRVRFIRHAQALGFALEDVQELLALRVTDPASCTPVAATTREKLQDVRERIRELRRMEHTLDALLLSCETRQRTDECPVLATLADDAGHARERGMARQRAARPRRTERRHA